MLGGNGGAVVIVARIRRLDARIRLRRQRRDYIRERIIRQPTHAVIVRLARPHPVTWNTGATTGTTGALARVIPCRKERAGWADRQVCLPLRTRTPVGVQLQRRTKGYAAVGGTNIINVARVTTGPVLGIDQVNHIVKSSRLTPALVSPEAPAIRKHAGEVPNSGNPRSWEGRAGIGVRPSVTAIS